MLSTITNLTKPTKKVYRYSRVRETILEILKSKKTPLSVDEIRTELKYRNLIPNKTSIYRAVEILLLENVISEVDLLDGRKRYENKEKNVHHHHLVCTNCHQITCADIDQQIQTIEFYLSTKYKFQSQTHQVEFFGLCRRCS